MTDEPREQEEHQAAEPDQDRPELSGPLPGGHGSLFGMPLQREQEGRR